MADAVWRGGAAGKAQIDLIPIGGTWADGDTATFTIGSAQLVITLHTNSVATTTTVAAAITAMINGDAITEDEVRSNTGNNVGEFAGLTATSSGANITITGRSDGTPFTITSTDTSALGTIGGSTTTTPTGAYHWDNVKNWLAGALPGAGDTINFDHRAVNGVRYAINLGQATAYGAMTVTEGFAHDIGLPAINNQESGLPYVEYRSRYLEPSATPIRILGGQGAMKLDTGAVAVDWYISRPSQGNITNEPTILIKNTAADDFFIGGGDIGICWDKGSSSTIDDLRISPEGGKEANVFCGAGLTLSTALKMNGGNCFFNSTNPQADISGGTYTQQAGALTTLNQDGGTVVYLSASTLGTARVSGGLIDFSKNLTGKTVTNFTITKGAGYRDPNGTVTHTNGIDLYGCSPNELSEFSIPKHRTITLSTI